MTQNFYDVFVSDWRKDRFLEIFFIMRSLLKNSNIVVYESTRVSDESALRLIAAWFLM